MSQDRIVMCDLKAAYATQKDAIDQAVARVLESGWFILGQECSAFEQEFGQFCGGQKAVGVANGTDALILAIKALGIGPGDGVITVSHTAVATAAAIEWAGAVPILVDISHDSYTMCPESVRSALATFKGQLPIKALIPVHLYGHPCDMNALMDIAREHDLSVIEDCSQAHGARIGEQQVGTYGDCATFSLYPTKNLGAFGDGGVVVSRRPDVCEQVELLRQYGWRERYISSTAGSNSRLDEIQAAILRVKLETLNESNANRRANAAYYDSHIELTDMVLPQAGANIHHVYHQYTVTHPNRDTIREALDAKGIASAILYPMAVHQQPAYTEAKRVELPHTEHLVRHLLCLPVHPQLSPKERQRVVEALNTID